MITFAPTFRYGFSCMKISSAQYIKHNGSEIDLLKFVLAIFVVGIHTSAVNFIGRPVFRVGVPIFIIISSYLFFVKQKTCATAPERKQGLVRYVKRIMKLYLFWFVFLLPVTVHKKWCVNPGFDTLVDVVRKFFFDSTFSGSWFLMALVLGLPVVWFLNEKKIHDFWILALGIMLYLLCCMTSVYRPLVANVPWLAQLLDSCETVIVCPHNSFVVGILFLAMGKMLAQRSFYVPNAVLIVMTVVSLVLLYGEYFFIKSMYKVTNDDCFLMLSPLSVCLFMLVGQNARFRLNFDTKPLRTYSTIIYCSHISVAYCLYQVLINFVKYKSAIYYLSLFSATLLLVLLLSYVLLRLEKRDSLHWLKYSH